MRSNAVTPLASPEAAEWVNGPEWWFDRLDPDHHRNYRPLVSVPHFGDTGLTRVGDVIDSALGVPLTTLLLSGSAPTIARGFLNPDKLLDVWSWYTNPAFLSDPRTFFVPPDESPAPARRRARDVWFRPADGEVWDLRTASTYEPRNPRTADRYLKHDDNGIAHARWWKHESGNRHTVICVHGYLASNQHLNAELFNVRWLYEKGLDVVLFFLPFHGERKHWVPGLAFPNFDLALTAEAWGQAVHDLQVLIGWLLRQGAASVGMTGVSLGGYTTALMAAIDERLAYAVPLIPATSLADCVMAWQPANLGLRLLFARLGVDLDDIRAFMAVHTPLQHAPVLPKHKLLIIGADGDHVTPPAQSRLLWEHWGGPSIHWYAGSHSMHAQRGTYLRRLGRFLGAQGVLDPVD